MPSLLIMGVGYPVGWVSECVGWVERRSLSAVKPNNDISQRPRMLDIAPALQMGESKSAAMLTILIIGDLVGIANLLSNLLSLPADCLATGLGLRGGHSIYAAVAAQLDLPLAMFDEDQSNRVVLPIKLEYLGKQE